MTPARRGSLVGATWLIGLGVVLLVQQSTQLSWDQLWPLFIILAGVAGLITRLLGWSRFNGVWGLTWSVTWTAAGVALLLSTTGTIHQGPGELIAEWWPYAAILAVAGLGYLFGLSSYGVGEQDPAEEDADDAPSPVMS